MRIRGWVYVISNEAMPDLVKVGYSTKDPTLRAQELAHTGAPHPYVVDYEAFVFNPLNVEQRAHKLLKDYREGREWFRCSLAQAIQAIQDAASDDLLDEEFWHATREEVESIRRQEEERQTTMRETLLAAQRLESQRAQAVAARVAEVEERYKSRIAKLTVQAGHTDDWIPFSGIIRNDWFLPVWVICTVVFVAVVVVSDPAFFLGDILSAIAISIGAAIGPTSAVIFYRWASVEKELQRVVVERDAEIAAIRAGATSSSASIESHAPRTTLPIDTLYPPGVVTPHITATNADTTNTDNR